MNLWRENRVFLEKKKKKSYLNTRHLKIKHYTSTVNLNENRQTWRNLKENKVIWLSIMHTVFNQSYLRWYFLLRKKKLQQKLTLILFWRGFFNNSFYNSCSVFSPETLGSMKKILLGESTKRSKDIKFWTLNNLGWISVQPRILGILPGVYAQVLE